MAWQREGLQRLLREPSDQPEENSTWKGTEKIRPVYHKNRQMGRYVEEGKKEWISTEEQNEIQKKSNVWGLISVWGLLSQPIAEAFSRVSLSKMHVHAYTYKSWTREKLVSFRAYASHKEETARGQVIIEFYILRMVSHLWSTVHLILDLLSP